jgi:two-component system, LuxR family, response regulator FixJ
MTPSVHAVTPAAQPKVFIVDDDPAMCRVLDAILSHAGHVCSTFSSAEAFLESVNISAAGCLLLDIQMPNMSGPELQAKMVERGFSLPIIFLSAAADVPTAVDVLRRGAVNLIEKPCEPGALIRAVQSAVVTSTARLAERSELDELQQCASTLTPRERQVADLLALGNSNKQVAIALALSERTVEVHRARIMAKMGCESIVNFGVQWAKLQSGIKSRATVYAASPEISPLYK